MFAPRSAVICSVFEGKSPAWKCRLPQVEENWTAGLQTLEGHALSISSLAFSHDGLVLASGSIDETVRLWDTATGDLKHVLSEHLQPVLSVAFSPKSQLLASGSEDETVRLWDGMTGNESRTFSSEPNPVELEYLPFTYDPDGTIVPINCFGKAFQKSQWGYECPVSEVTFSHDGQMLAFAFCYTKDRSMSTIELWDLGTDEKKYSFTGHSDRISSLAFPSCNSQILASGSQDGTVRIWDTTTGEATQMIKHGMIHRNQRFFVWSVAFWPDTQILAYGSNDGTVRLWDTATGKEKQIFEDEMIRSNTVTTNIWSLAFSPDGQVLASGSSDGIVRLWHTTTGKLQRTLELHSHRLSVAISPNGQLLASGSSDGTVRLWDTAIDTAPLTPKSHSDQVSSLDFSPNGQLLASCSIDKTIRLWDTATGKLRKTWQAEDWIPSDVQFSKDGSSLQTNKDSFEVRSFYDSNLPYGKQVNVEISIEQSQWIKLNNERVLWLPPGSRPSCWAVFDSAIAIGHASGYISFIDFDPPEA